MAASRTPWFLRGSSVPTVSRNSLGRRVLRPGGLALAGGRCRTECRIARRWNHGDPRRIDAEILEQVVASPGADRDDRIGVPGAPVVAPAIAPAVDQRKELRVTAVDQVVEGDDRRDAGARQVAGDFVRQAVIDVDPVARRAASGAIGPPQARRQRTPASRLDQPGAELGRKIREFRARRPRREQVELERKARCHAAPGARRGSSCPGRWYCAALESRRSRRGAAVATASRPAGRRGTPPAGSRRCRPASSASCPPSASPAACACG